MMKGQESTKKFALRTKESVCSGKESKVKKKMSRENKLRETLNGLTLVTGRNDSDTGQLKSQAVTRRKENRIIWYLRLQRFGWTK